MTAYGLTPAQHHLFGFVRREIIEGRPPPSYAEMQGFTGLRSKSGINRLVNGIVERGHLVRLPGRARALALPGTSSELAMRQAAIKDAQSRLDRDGDRLAINLPHALAGELLTYCDRARAIPSDVVATALIEHMRRHP